MCKLVHVRARYTSEPATVLAIARYDNTAPLTVTLCTSVQRTTTNHSLKGNILNTIMSLRYRLIQQKELHLVYVLAI